MIKPLVEYMAASGNLGMQIGVNVVAGSFGVNSAPKCTAVIARGGAVNPDLKAIRQTSIQLWTRAMSNDEAITEQTRIFEWLINQGGFSIVQSDDPSNAWLVYSITTGNSPAWVSIDDSGHYLYSANLVIRAKKENV